MFESAENVFGLLGVPGRVADQEHGEGRGLWLLGNVDDLLQPVIFALISKCVHKIGTLAIIQVWQKQFNMSK